MLITLHNLINDIVPIEGISQNENGTFRIDYLQEPTPNQQELITAAINSYPLIVAKVNRLKTIEEERNQIEKIGWDCGQGHLGLSSSDVALLSGAFSLAKEASNMGLPLPSIITMEDTQIDFNNIQEMTMLMLRYGAARAELSKTFANRRRAVESATTIEEVNEA